MIRPIVKDPLFLQQISQPATQADLTLANDLVDTLEAHKDACVGLAANMIGVQKRVIVIRLGLFPLVLFNPVLKDKKGPYQAEEGCLSLAGTRTTTRYREIVVAYYDRHWQKQEITLTDFPAQICQHELDHLEGILI
ncbi:peptide deformylase [Streptococcus himalayensis]|uniref:Peptide deformylase n=1 Tax=Streptococcus himalayensis TaxID=1888195 RepID=A0A917A8Z4_9STRE|nr:peptide deformylase [Streptococcus himalayensis]GGE35827.1 peptide deformylase [Streptococcus himalayensis]